MEQVLLKAATTATTDRGEFTAIAAAYSVDRVKDRIVPGAFKNTIDRWQASGKRIPLHWNHEGDAKNIIGAVDPTSMHESDKGLYVEGKVDISASETAREAWRSIKNGTMSLSFGYLVTKARKAAAGVTELLDIDLFEVSIVPVPANGDTKILSVKALPADDLASRLSAMASEMTSDSPPKPEEIANRMRAMADEIKSYPKEADQPDVEEPGEARSADSLRKDSRRLELEVSGVAVAKTSGHYPWDDLRRESYQLMADVLSE